MRTIGIRAAPAVITFAVVEAETRTVRMFDEIKVPLAFETPDALKYVRSNLLDVLREQDIRKAGIRVTEANAQHMNVGRIQIEGVILEAFASSPLEGFYVGYSSSICGRLGVDRKRFRPLVDGEEDLGILDWETFSAVQREAILTAMGAINA